MATPPRDTPALSAKAACVYAVEKCRNVGIPVDPETLRLAKQNDPSSKTKLWTLLHATCLLASTGWRKPRAEPHAAEKLWRQDQASAKRFVCHTLSTADFPLASHFRVQVCGDDPEPRLLLVAFGFLLMKHNVIFGTVAREPGPRAAAGAGAGTAGRTLPSVLDVCVSNAHEEATEAVQSAAGTNSDSDLDDDARKWKKDVPVDVLAHRLAWSYGRLQAAMGRLDNADCALASELVAASGGGILTGGAVAGITRPIPSVALMRRSQVMKWAREHKQPATQQSTVGMSPTSNRRLSGGGGGAVGPSSGKEADDEKLAATFWAWLTACLQEWKAGMGAVGKSVPLAALPQQSTVKILAARASEGDSRAAGLCTAVAQAAPYDRAWPSCVVDDPDEQLRLSELREGQASQMLQTESSLFCSICQGDFDADGDDGDDGDDGGDETGGRIGESVGKIGFVWLHSQSSSTVRKPDVTAANRTVNPYLAGNKAADGCGGAERRRGGGPQGPGDTRGGGGTSTAGSGGHVVGSVSAAIATSVPAGVFINAEVERLQSVLSQAEHIVTQRRHELLRELGCLATDHASPLELDVMRLPQ